MNFKDFLKHGKLKTKTLKLKNIDDELTIRQLSMLEQLELLDRFNLRASEENLSSKEQLEMVKNNSLFRLEAVKLALVSPSLSDEDLKDLNNKSLEIIAQIADEILAFTNESEKQAGKGASNIA